MRFSCPKVPVGHKNKSVLQSVPNPSSLVKEVAPRLCIELIGTHTPYAASASMQQQHQQLPSTYSLTIFTYLHVCLLLQFVHGPYVTHIIVANCLGMAWDSPRIWFHVPVVSHFGQFGFAYNSLRCLKISRSGLLLLDKTNHFIPSKIQ